MSRALTLVYLLLFGLLTSSCAGGDRQKDERLVEEKDARSDDEILFASIIDTFQEEGIDVDVASEDRGVVLSPWEPVNDQVRHRWMARVIRAKVGLALKVLSQYERKDLSGEEPRWVEAEDPYTLKQAQREEQRLGRAIQERFRALGGGKS